jgi:signal transduction histidine kinase
LFAANLIATLFLARDLARPVEWLGDYAINVQRGSVPARIPQNFKIREFNHLSVALNSMVERLTAWATELESAWQEAKTANQLKNQFLTTISHELRTPLNAILGSLRLVRDDCCDNRQEEKEFLQRADDAAIHLLNIINDILDISKIEAGALSVNLELVDLHAIIEEAIDLQKNLIRAKGLQLNLPHFPEKVWVQADPDKLKQVLLNILGNAIKFTEEGSITIAIRVESSGQTNGTKTLPNLSRAIVSIQDTGIGVAPETQDKLFQPFVMVDGSKTRKFGGTGLGLAISRNLTELMGGSVSLYSEGIGQGTTVEITLPKTHASPSLEPIDVRRTT